MVFLFKTGINLIAILNGKTTKKQCKHPLKLLEQVCRLKELLSMSPRLTSFGTTLHTIFGHFLPWIGPLFLYHLSILYVNIGVQVLFSYLVEHSTCFE